MQHCIKMELKEEKEYSSQWENLDELNKGT